MSIVLINDDNTVNYIGDKLESWLVLDGVEVVEDDRTPAEIQDGVRPVDAVWFWKDGTVVSDKDHPDLVGVDKQQEYKRNYLREHQKKG